MACHATNDVTNEKGPTVITAHHCIAELFTNAGRSLRDYVELLPVSPFYRLFWTADGDSFDYDGDAENMRAQIHARCTDDVDGYVRIARGLLASI